jgi:hypothetical protein
MFLGLVTLAFLIAFTLFYIGKSMTKKPEWLGKAVDNIVAHLDTIAFWGVIYGLVAIVLVVLLGNYDALLLFVSLIANVLVIVMALPFSFEKLSAKLEPKANAAVAETLRDLVGGVSRNEKYIGYAGAVIAFLMFAVLFR